MVWKSIAATMTVSSLDADGVRDTIVTGPALVWFPDAVTALSNGDVVAPPMSYRITSQSPTVHDGFTLSVIFVNVGLVTAFGAYIICAQVLLPPAGPDD